METLVHISWFKSLLLLICSLGVSSKYVTTKHGHLIGKTILVYNSLDNQEMEVEEYLGVPFAKPPIGDLRFAKPTPMDPWECKFAQIMPKACFQKSSAFPWGRNDVFMSEDCLYMNIWVPNFNEQILKPVLFFIPGGGYYHTFGSASQHIYRGHALAAIGDIIVVVPNYRKGLLGFWTSNSTSAPGNVGIWDVIEALKWVKENIEAFGGDKESITVGGQGSGAVIATLLAAAPAAKGLFKRQILQSGSAISTYFDSPLMAEASKKVGEVFCSSVIATKELLVKCMRGKEVHELMRQSLRVDNVFQWWGDELFPTSPKQTLLYGDLRFITEVLIGFSGSEGIPIVNERLPGIFGYLGERNPKFTRKQATVALENMNFIPFLLNRFNETYFKFLGECNENRRDWRHLLAALNGDETVVCPVIYYATSAAKNNAKVYFYEFRYRPDKSVWSKWVGTTHFDEMDFVFGGPFKSKSYYSDGEKRLSKMMITHWSDFVKYGRPKRNWPAFKSLNDVMVYLDSRDPVLLPASTGHHCVIWKDYIAPIEYHYFPDYAHETPIP